MAGLRSGPFTPTGALRARYSILVVLVTAVGIGVVGFVYTNYVQRQADQHQAELRRVSDQRWCALFELLDPQGAPPTTERGRLVQQQIHALVIQFGCKEKP